MTRRDGRGPADLRPVEIRTGYLRTCPGSVLYRCGGTSIIVTAQIGDDVPPWLASRGTGWLTAEYAMLPGSTPTRKKRGPDGRATEIQRLIGRSLRSAVDLRALGPVTLSIDADVIEADGGTRTAAITGAYVAAAIALRKRFGDDSGKLIKAPVAAVSAGIIDGVPMLDLDYSEDSRADVDLNVVRLGADGFVEVQGTGEGGVFRRDELASMLDLAASGIDRLMETQRTALLNAGVSG